MKTIKITFDKHLQNIETFEKLYAAKEKTTKSLLDKN